MSPLPPPDLAPERIAEHLRTQRYGRSLRVLALTDSTNDDAQRDAAAGAPDGHVVISDAQRSGRGSHGRAWTSPAGTDLYLSIVTRPTMALAELPPLTLAVGLGVADAVGACLSKTAAPRPEVKWPNDVWIAGRKCSGILVEASSHGARLGPVVIGIGLNVNRAEFPVELRARATALREWTDLPLDRAVALGRVLEHVERWVDRFASAGGDVIASALQDRLALLGQSVRCSGIEGRVLGVAASGALRLSTEAGARELVAGTLEPVP